MTTVTIVPENPGSPDTKFRAVSRRAESVGDTAGAALDALTRQLDDTESGTLVVVQNLPPDEFFTAEQQQRLRELMDGWRAARNAGRTLLPAEQAELEALVDAELRGATRRAAAMAGEVLP